MFMNDTKVVTRGKNANLPQITKRQKEPIEID